MRRLTAEQIADNSIRLALRDAADKGRLDIVAQVTGFPGGVEALKLIMRTHAALDAKDRLWLAAHLEFPT